MVLEHLLTVARLRALLDATRLVRSGDDVQHLLERIAETIADSLRFRTVAVNVYRPEWDDFEVAAVHGNDAARAALLGTSTDAETWQRLLDDRFATRGAYLIRHGEFSWDDQAPTVFVSEPAQPSADADAWHHEDALVVPLTHSDGRRLGVISVDEPRSGRLPSDEELDVLVAVADQAALALQQTLDSADAERHRAKLEQLLELSAGLNDSGPLDATLEAVCGGIRDVLGFRKVSLQLLDRGSGAFAPRVSAGWGTAGAPAASVSVEDVLSLLDSRFEVAGCYLLSHDEGVARVGKLDLPTSVCNGRGPHAWARHWLVVPLEDARGELIGFIWADDPADLLLPRAERLQALRTFANHASSALTAAERSEAAAESDARKAAVVEAALDCVITFDDDGRIVEFNQAAEETLGWTSEEAIGTLLVDLLVPAWLSADFERHLDGARDRKPDRIELSAVRSNGREFEAELAIVRVPTPGAPLYTAFIRDISKHKQSEERLRDTELKYRSLVEGLPMATYINEPGLPVRTRYMSPQIEAMLGYAPDEWLQPDFFLSRVHPDDLERVLADVAPTHGAGAAFRSEYRLLAKDGKVVWVLDVTSAVCDEEHRPLFLQGFLVDVTERRETEEALRESAEQLRQSQKIEAVGALAGGIAHDFNNLLTAINGHTEFALDRLNGSAPAVREELEQIGHVAERASALTQQLLAFSRRQVLNPTVLHVNEVVRETLALLRRVIPTAIDLRTTLADDLAPVHADRVQLEQVLLNLAVNGRDAMPAGGTLSMSTSEVVLDGSEGLALPLGPYVLLELTDTGYGMDAETQARIFEPFFTTKGNGGTGLGLATVYGIVAQSGGAIAVDSVPGRGATFRVYLPCSTAAARAGEEPSDTPHTAGITTDADRDRGARVLVVDDQDSVRDLLRRMLEHQGHSVATCADPAGAIALGEQQPFDLAVIDLHLRGECGRALARELLGRRPGLRVLFVSGDSHGGDDGELPPGSGFGFLPKPFSMASLGEAARSLLGAPLPAPVAG